MASICNVCGGNVKMPPTGSTETQTSCSNCGMAYQIVREANMPDKVKVVIDAQKVGRPQLLERLRALEESLADVKGTKKAKIKDLNGMIKDYEEEIAAVMAAIKDVEKSDGKGKE